MINDLSRTLKHLLTIVPENEPEMFPLLKGKDIVFARPDKDYKPNAQGSVCLFLYDIRENRELRSNEPLRVNRDGQSRIGRPPTRVVCSYLITAWPAEAVGLEGEAKLNIDSDTAHDVNLLEHLLLSEVLQVLSRYPTIPISELQGKLASPEQPLPLPMITAQAEGLNNISEFWSAIGSNLRPSLNVKATIAMQVSQPKDEGPPITERKVEFEPARFDIAGHFKDEKNAAVAGARIEIVELGRSTTSDSTGAYSFSKVPIGKYRLNINWKTDQKLNRRNVEISVPGGLGAYDVYAAAAYDVQGQFKTGNARLVGAGIRLDELAVSTTSDQQGGYKFAQVPVGKYSVRVNWKTEKDAPVRIFEIHVPAVSADHDVNAPDVEGLVKDGTGAPVSGAAITILELRRGTTSDSKGHYSFGLLPIGKHSLRVRWKDQSKSVEINVPAAAGAYDIELKG
jgi:hypothetical protein